VPPARATRPDGSKAGLCRYTTRPALSDERAQINDSAQVESKVETP
jgi:hypothetical protein